MSFINSYRYGGVYDSSRSGLFDGVNESINIGQDSSIDFERTDSFSYSFWFYKTSSGTLLLYRSFLTTGNFTGIAVYVESTGSLRLDLANDTSPSNRIVVRTSTTPVSLNTWCHAVYTYDGSSNASGVNLYYNGSAQGITTLVDTLSATIVSGLDHHIAGFGSSFWGGNIDEVSIWNKELSAAEVSDIYNSGCPDNLNNHSASANLVSWFPFDSNDDMTATTGTVYDKVGVSDGTPSNTEVGDLTTTLPC